MNTSTGFTFIEVLIAVVILASGLLGLAALQATSLKNTQSAYYRSQATQMAYDLADRMRANVAGAATYTSILPSAVAAETPTCKNTTGCPPAQMATTDLYQWNQALTANTSAIGGLPNAEAIICLDTTPGDGTSASAPACTGTGTVNAIKIWWDDDVSRSGNGNKQLFVVSFQL